MNILYIGQLNDYGYRLCNYMSANNKVAAISDDECKYECFFDKYSTSSNAKNIVDENRIDTVLIFISKKCGVENIYALIYSIVTECETIKQIFFIEENDIIRESINMPSLCCMMSDELNCHTSITSKVISVSALYGNDFIPNYIEKKVNEAIKYNTINPDGHQNQFCDAIHVDDFCEALSLIISSNSNIELEHIELISGYSFKLSELLNCIKYKYHQINIAPYSDNEKNSDINFTKIDDWSPKHNFLSEIDSLLSIAEQKQTLINTVKLKIGVNKFLCFIIFIIGFVLVELYTSFISTASDLQFVDLRLLFIVVTSLIAGKKYGTVSAILCSVSSVVHLLISGYKWYVLFFHIDNWIPIVIYLVVAIIIGSLKQSNIVEKK